MPRAQSRGRNGGRPRAHGTRKTKPHAVTDSTRTDVRGSATIVKAAHPEGCRCSGTTSLHAMRCHHPSRTQLRLRCEQSSRAEPVSIDASTRTQAGSGRRIPRLIPRSLALATGAPGRSRTRNLVGRNHPLYPVELQGRKQGSKNRWRAPLTSQDTRPPAGGSVSGVPCW